MRTAENESAALYRFVSPGVLEGWEVEVFNFVYRDEQVDLIESYLDDPDSPEGLRLQYMGLVPSVEVDLATTTNIVLSGSSVNIDGVLSGVNTILVKNQTNPEENGIYLSSSGAWSRSENITSDTVVLVKNGDTNSRTLWVNSTIDESFVLDTDPIYFEDAFTQCIRVSPGKGIISIYPARTSNPFYFRLPNPEIFYVWAEASLCLQTEYIAAITAPLSPDEEWDQKRDATYLASVEVAEDNTTGIPYVLDIEYGDRRNVLKNLAGALQTALRRAFYRHVHIGGPNSPTKINLSTHLTLKAEGPLGSTIFIVKTLAGVPFTWDSSSYGVPVVRVNNRVLPSSSYVLDSGQGKLFLKNSVSQGSTIQIVLPLSPQKTLRIHEDYNITSPYVFLTDGSTQTNEDGAEEEIIFLWSSDDYHTPEVYLKNELLDDRLYTAIPERGAIVFNDPDTFDPPLSSYNDTDLAVTLTRLGSEISGTLSGKRLTNIDASTFTRGKLDTKRLSNLDHVGQVRFREVAELRPTLRLFPEGDHKTFYPEIPDSALQYGTDCYYLFRSKNFTLPILIGSKRGLIQTTDFFNTQFVSSWLSDRGRIKFILDEILQADDLENHFKTTWLITEEGRIWSTKDLGLSWQITKQPIVGQNTAIGKSLWVSSQRDEKITNFLVNYEWSTNVYFGTNLGLFTANIREGQSENEWSWTRLSRYRDENGLPIDDSSIGTINAIQEIVTVNTSTNSSTGDVTKTFNKTLYIGATTGLYVGGNGEVKRISADNVKGFHWIRNGDVNNSLNDLLWWTDAAVYITHTARFFDDGEGNTTWTNPLTLSNLSFSNVRVGTVENVDLNAAPNIVDGITLLANNRILVKNQTNREENGIYTVQTLGTGSDGVWVRAVDADQNSEFTAYKRVYITNGDDFGDSSWYLKPDPDNSSYNIGVTDINWHPVRLRVYQNVSSEINGITQRDSRSDYLVAHALGCATIEDNFEPGALPASINLPWDDVRQGSCNSIMSMASQNSDEGVLFAASDRGIWKSTDSLWNINLNSPPWVRARNEFYEANQPTIYDQVTFQEVLTGFAYSEVFQSFDFVAVQSPWKRFVYERDYQKFYTRPWNTNAEVVVYINAQQSHIPYSLNPLDGSITFTESLGPIDAKLVTITIVRDGAFVSNTGTTPHEELPRSFLISAEPVTRLARRLSPADLIIYVEDASEIPVNANYIEIRSSTAREKISINVDPTTRAITIPFPRSTQNIFEPGSSVHIISTGTKLGIEDEITLAQSNLTYHFASVDNANTIRLAAATENEFPGLYENFTGTPVNNTAFDRGLKKSIVLDMSASPSPLDNRATNSALFVGLGPSSAESASQPQATYAIINPSKSGDQMRVGTDKGTWIYQSDKWLSEADLNKSARAYFIKDINGTLTIGADTGLWEKDTDNNWIQNPTFTQATFDYISGSWFGGTFEAWGKEDGLAFVTVPQNNESFISDHFDPVDGRRVYGLYKDQFIRLKTDANGNTVQEKIDALYLCTEDGLYGVTNGSRGGVFSSVLKGREMFGSNPINAKIYKIFKAPSTPPSTKETIPLFILTSNGIYKVRNWRWCDPEDANGLDFFVESRFLEGISCYCVATSTKSDVPTPPGQSKCFVGTDRGVFRSFTEGNNWEACERIEGGVTAVYDLKIFSSTFSDGIGNITREVILAATELGLYYSIDEGDTWYRAGSPTIDGWYPVTFGSTIESRTSFGGGWLSQSFKASNGIDQITKVSFYVSLRNLDEDDPRYTASLNNTLTAYIYEVDSNGKPTTQLPYSSSGVISGLISSGYLPSGFVNPDVLTASSVEHPGFKSLYLPVTLPDTDLTYAVVIRETIASGGTSIFQWQLSSRDNPYENGEAMVGGVTPTWAYANTDRSLDFFFRVNFEANSEPIQQNIPVGFYDANMDVGFLRGSGRGFVVRDDGALTTDTKFAVVFVVDDSASQAWSDPLNRRDAEIGEIISDLWARTNTTVSLQPYSVNYGDFWQFGTSIQNRSNGYTNNSNQLINYAVALRERGNNSELMETIASAIAGLSPQAIIEFLLRPDDSVGNADRVTELVQYHIDRNILRLNDIRSWYALQRNMQATLNGTLSAPTIYNLRKTGSSTNYIWSATTFPYIEVLNGGVLMDPLDYTINPASGTLTTAETITSLVVNLRVDWDGTASGISSSETASSFLVDRWAKSFTPAAFVFADGDNISIETGDVVATQANTTWDDDGVAVQCFGLGRSHAVGGLRTIADRTRGQHFDITNGADGQDWDTAANSLLHGGENSIFESNWSRLFDFNDPTWIKSVHTTYNTPTALIQNSFCSVEVRWTKNRINWSSWVPVLSATPLTIEEELLGIEYRIILRDGWTGSAAVRPTVTQLYHIQVEPSRQYLITPPYDIDGMLFEYILSAEADLPRSSRISWGIARGDISDWAYYEPVFNNRNGALSNRQESILFTPEIIRENLRTSTQDNFVFQVFEDNNSFARWTTEDTVQIRVDGIAVADGRGAYSLDGERGLIYFAQEIPNGSVVTATIITPSEIFISEGESTSTLDNRTYYLSNGRWPHDSNIVVLVNGVIVRGGWFANNEEGVVTFTKERSRTDIVTVFVQPSGQFRIGAEVKNYSSTPVNISKCGLFYTSRSNTNLFFRMMNTPVPTIEGDVIIAPESPSIYQRMQIQYIFKSEDNNTERGTRTAWYRKRGGGSFLRIGPENGLPNYDNRTVERLEDLAGADNVFLSGDEVYVEVIPSDGFSEGITYTSDIVTLRGLYQPYVFDATISAVNKIESPENSGIFYITANQELRARYVFNDGDGGGDILIDGGNNLNLVQWYDNNSNIPIYTGPRLPANYVTKGRVISFVATPYDGDDFGSPATSDEVTVR